MMRLTGDACVFRQAQDDQPLSVQLEGQPTDADKLVDGRAEIAVADPEVVGNFVKRSTEIVADHRVQDAALSDDRSQRNLNREVWG